MKWRLTLIRIGFLIFVSLLLLRLSYWQIIQSDNLKKQAILQYSSSLEILSLRGQIQGSDQFPLVANSESYLLYANPQETSDISQLVNILPASDSAKLSTLLQKKHLFWTALAHQLPLSVKLQIDSLKLKGIGFESEPDRFYPEGSVSAHLLGFVGQNSNGQPQGYFGLEGFYDRQLSGRPGRLIQEQDAFGNPIVIGGVDRIPPQDGQPLATSIDRTLQFIIYHKLLSALDKYKATGGTVTVMNPKTGEIIAMVSLPNYDPDNYQRFDPSLYPNPVISRSYEPGSTFKVIVMAAALDTKSVIPQTKCTICTQSLKIYDYSIKTWNDKYHPNSTMTEVLQNSDNVGMVFVARKLGKKKLYDYLQRFGMGQLTGIDLQEENAPPLRPDSAWQEIDFATMSFGQGIAVTPIQMTRAIGAIANQGKIVVPHVAKTKNNSTSRQVISTATAAQVTQMMIESVDGGEGKFAKVPGFTIAGKTGTAQVPIAGHYDEKKTIGSFIGFAPAHNPKFVMLVTLDEPKTSPWGSRTAAPLWAEIAKEIFRLYHIPPN